MFTDIEGSTRLLHELSLEAYRQALAEHRRVVREACARHHGYEVDYEGDSFFYAFASAVEAVSAVSEAMDGLEGGPIRIRVGIHTGEPGLDPPKYVGLDVHRAARIMSAAHGGQVLFSESTHGLVDVDAKDLGEHRLKDLSAPQRLYQLGDADFPRLRTLHQTNLPVPVTPFLGREQELGQVIGLLRREGIRLLTLTGPGGTGKTRLAAQAAADVSDDYPDGVYWVSLAALRDPALVLGSVAQVLGAKADLAGHIDGKRLLLLLDNLEQVIDCAPKLAVLLSSCPNLMLLTTSREPLRLAAEQEYPVPTLNAADGVSLFIARARAMQPSFEPSPAVAELCARLDELPLAIELAAARTKLLTAEQLLDLLTQRLDLLTGGPRDADPRQQTLRATIEWSNDLLTGPEQHLLARLSVFAGGCTLDTAKQVADADLDTLQSLLEKSLVRRTDDRFWMLETIREYAWERLEERGEATALRERHATYFLHLATALEPVLRRRQGRPFESALETLESEYGNLRLALDWWSQQGAAEEGLRLAHALWEYWYVRGPVAEGWEWFATMLARTEGQESLLRARALHAASALSFKLGAYDETRTLALEALALFRLLGDARRAALPLNMLAEVASRQGDPAKAASLFEESMALLRETGDARDLAYATVNRAYLTLTMGGKEATPLLEEALAMFRETDDAQGTAACLQNLGFAALLDGRDADARRHLSEALTLARELSDKQLMSYCLQGLGACALEDGAAPRASTLLGAAEALLETSGGLREPVEQAVWDRAVATTRDLLGDQAAAEAFERGRALTPEAAVAFAVE